MRCCLKSIKNLTVVITSCITKEFAIKHLIPDNIGIITDVTGRDAVLRLAPVSVEHMRHGGNSSTKSLGKVMIIVRKNNCYAAFKVVDGRTDSTFKNCEDGCGKHTAKKNVSNHADKELSKVLYIITLIEVFCCMIHTVFIGEGRNCIVTIPLTKHICHNRLNFSAVI